MSLPRVVFFGDSHTHAVARALKTHALADHFRVYQMKRRKNDREIGDVSIDEAREVVAGLGTNDAVVSLMGGNQHQVLGLVQHEVPFDVFYAPEQGDTAAGAQVIPRAVLLDLFEHWVLGKDWARLAQILKDSRTANYHVVPPPPKEDEAHIRRRHETAFQATLLSRGISPAPLRLSLWRLQADALVRIGEEGGVAILGPPPGTQTPDGYLRPEYYADDATHANIAYGALVLDAAARLVGLEPQSSLEAGL